MKRPTSVRQNASNKDQRWMKASWKAIVARGDLGADLPSEEVLLLQLKKEELRNEYERHKLQALIQCPKMVFQRMTEEAAIATKRLKELLKARKSNRDISEQ